jgi:hypothetical protein
MKVFDVNAVVEKLRDTAFKDQNHVNLATFACLFLKLDVVGLENFTVEHQEWNESYKVSLGDKLFYIDETYLPKFWFSLNQEELEPFFELRDKLLNEEDDSIVFSQAVTIDESQIHIDESDPFYEMIGEDFAKVDKRIGWIVTNAKQNIINMAKLFNKDMEIVAKDTSIVKDFDAWVTFDTQPGKDFDLKLCFDTIPPVMEDNGNIRIERTHMTQEQLEKYFPTGHKSIAASIKDINEHVRVLFNNKRIKGSEFLTKYLERLVNAFVVQAFVKEEIEYISFGGMDDWTSAGKETPNNKACFEYLDKEVENIFNTMDAIPKESDEMDYSIDIDTFCVFGRINNKVVTAAVPGITGELLKHYSKGFERLLSIRLAQLDTVKIFRG